MSLTKYDGNTIYHNLQQITNAHEGVEIDYYFMAKKFGGSQTEISMKIWTVIIDSQSNVYGMKTKHMGHFEDWQKVISDRLKDHLLKVGCTPLQITRMLRDIDIKKDGHIIPWDYRCTGTRIGIDGSNQLYIRKNKF